MNINRIASTAQAGIQSALARFDDSAQRTARMNAPNPENGTGVDVAQEVVQQSSAKHEVSANIAVLRTADEMVGRLLDLKV
jgi:flagellar hook protein FlgE